MSLDPYMYSGQATWSWQAITIDPAICVVSHYTCELYVGQSCNFSDPSTNTVSTFDSATGELTFGTEDYATYNSVGSLAFTVSVHIGGFSTYTAFFLNFGDPCASMTLGITPQTGPEYYNIHQNSA